MKLNNNDLLFNCLFEHLSGPTKGVVRLCIYASGNVRFSKAKEILQMWFGYKHTVVQALRKKLLSTYRTKDNIDCLSQFANDLIVFQVLSK